MRYGLIPESLLERALLSLGLMPNAMTEAYAPLHARAIVLATELGVWDAISSGGLSAEAVAAACGTHPAATARLEAGLAPRTGIPLRFASEVGLQVADKPSPP